MVCFGKRNLEFTMLNLFHKWWWWEPKKRQLFSLIVVNIYKKRKIVLGQRKLNYPQQQAVKENDKTVLYLT